MTRKLIEEIYKLTPQISIDKVKQDDGEKIRTQHNTKRDYTDRRWKKVGKDRDITTQLILIS